MTIVAHNIGAVGGMERALSELIEGLLSLGVEVTVVARRCALRPRPGLRHVPVRGPARPFALAYPWFFLAGAVQAVRHRRGLLHVTGALVGCRADVATVHFCNAALPAGAATVRATRRTVLYGIHGRIASQLSRAGERWCYRPSRLRRLVGVSPGVAREVESHFPAMATRLSVIPNGVDTHAFRPDPRLREASRAALALPPDALVALFVGSEWDRKGLRHAIDALARSPAWRLLVVGDGDEARFRRHARALGTSERILFAGTREDVADLYRAADAFVLPTRYETFSLVAYEAAASGLPLLVTRVSGIEDLLAAGAGGWFVDRDGEDIARRLDELAESPALRERLGKASRTAAESFGWDAVVERYVQLYGELGPPNEPGGVPAGPEAHGTR